MNRLALLLPLALVACKKDEGTPKKASEKPAETKPAETKPKAPAGPFDAWDMDARRAAFQGAWITEGSSIGDWQAWKVDGDKITIFDAGKETTATLIVQSPCEAAVKITSADGSSTGYISHYTIKDGQMITGMGDAGAKRGKEAIACVSNRVVTLDAGGACTLWEASMFDDGTYDNKGPGKCGFSADGTKFTANVDGSDYELVVAGDALLSQQMLDTHNDKAADYDAAKAALAAKKS